MKEYFLCKWLHDSLEYPKILFHEIDDNRYEIRKIEIYKDGKVLFADKNEYSNKIRLSSEKLPSISEINSDKQFDAKIITSEYFNNLWNIKTEISYPPETLDNAKVLEFLYIDKEIRQKNMIHIIIDENSNEVNIEPFVHLAIASYNKLDEFYLFYCDKNWSVITDTYWNDIKSLKRQANYEYENIQDYKWIEYF